MIVPQSTLVHENKKKAKLFKEERDLPIFVDRILRKSFIFPFLGEFAQISALGRGQKSKLAKISSATSFCIPNGTWKPREIFDFRKKSIYSPPLSYDSMLEKRGNDRTVMQMIFVWATKICWQQSNVLPSFNKWRWGISFTSRLKHLLQQLSG